MFCFQLSKNKLFGKLFRMKSSFWLWVTEFQTFLGHQKFYRKSLKASSKADWNWIQKHFMNIQAIARSYIFNSLVALHQQKLFVVNRPEIRYPLLKACWMHLWDFHVYWSDIPSWMKIRFSIHENYINIYLELIKN